MDQDDSTQILQMISLALTGIKKELESNNITLINVNDSRQKSVTIHRLLAEIFLPDYDELLHVNHKDGDKLNNSLSNLEMVTHQENMAHASRIGLIRTRKLTPLQVLDIKNLIKEGNITMVSIAKIYGVSPDLIYNIKSGKAWKFI